MNAAPIPNSRWFHRTSGAWHYWLILLLTVVHHLPLLLPGMGMPQAHDFYSFHSPMRIMAAKALHEGNIPFLTQGIYGGYPLYSDPQFAFFYPINFLFSLLVPNPNGEAPLDGYIFSNLVALSLAALFFARSFGFGRAASLAAAVVMVFNGFVQMHITHINILQVMASGYLAAGLLMRLAWSGGKCWRLSIGAGLSLAAGNLAGHPQTTMWLHYALGAGMLAVAVVLWSRTRDRHLPIRVLGWSLLAVLLGLSVAAIQLLPTAHLISICTRIHMSRGEAMSEAIRLQHLPSMLFPGFYMPIRWQAGWPLYVEQPVQWLAPNPLESLTFGGVVVFAMGLLGILANPRKPMAHILFWSSMFLLGASVGEQLPFYGWLYDYVPLVDVVRVPSRVLWMFYTAWALLAAMGVRACMTRTAAAGARRTFFLLAGFFWVGVLVVVGNFRTAWYDAAIKLFVHDHGRYDELIHRNHDLFVEAIKGQFFFGLAVVSFTLLWLVIVWQRRGGRWLVVPIFLVMYAELFIYGFGASYTIKVLYGGRVEAAPLAALTEKPAGRVLVPAYVHGGGPLNAAIFAGSRLVNGYSVTYPDWVKAFEIGDVPPWRNGRDETLLKIWNVSDIVVRKRSALARLLTLNVPLDDWGWAEIGAPRGSEREEGEVTDRALMPGRLEMSLEDVTTPVINLHVLCTARETLALTDGVEIATLTALPRETGSAPTTYSLRLGNELGDAFYRQHLERVGPAAHRQPPVAFTRDAIWEWTDGAQMYFVSRDLPTTVPLSALSFQATGPYPSVLGIELVLVGLEDGTVLVRYPALFKGYNEVESADSRFRVLRRQEPSRYAWMVPQAVRGSYKETANIMWRMFNGEFDPQQNVIVDKRQYKPEDARRTDAADPAGYEGQATIKWLRDEIAEIHTKASDQGWLVISMTWDKGWRAFIDGAEVPLARANGPHCAVPVPAGNHVVRLEYKPVHWHAGRGISIAALIGSAVGLIWRRRKLLA